MATLAELLKDKRFREDVGSNTRDFFQSASNTAAANVALPIDAISWLLRKGGVPIPEAPVFSSQWAKNAGLMAEPKDPKSFASLLGDAAGNIAPMVGYAKAPEIARGLLKADEALKPVAGRMVDKYMDKIGGKLGIVPSSLSKTGDPVDAGRYFKYSGPESLTDVGKMTKEEFDTFYKNLPYHHQGKFDRLLRASSPAYEDLPTTMGQYAKDFGYENPGLVNKFAKVKPDDQVSIYRSVTNADPDKAIMPGDWIALERKYAALHGRSGNDKARMITAKVPAKDVRWAGTSADEYFYTPSSGINQETSSTHDALLRLLSRNGQNLP